MSMSTYVQGFKQPNDQWLRMKAAFDACVATGVPAPAEVIRYFADGSPDDGGQEVDVKAAVRSWYADGREGLEVMLAELPPLVTRLRFVNSW